MLHPDPAQWRAQPIYDMFASPVLDDATNYPSWKVGRRPTFVPTLTYDNHGNIVILAGTGDVDSPIDSARQRVVSLTELRNVDDSTSTNNEITGSIQLNWQIDLDVNEGVTGPLTAFDDKVYFATFESRASANQCALGVSRIYGVHAYQNNSTTTVLSIDPKPELTETNAAPGAAPVVKEIFDPTGSNLLIGLTVKRQPICQTKATVINPATGQAVPASAPGGGLYQLAGVLSSASNGGRLIGTNAQIKELPPLQSLQMVNYSSVSSWASYAD
jgi:hypothetical protein